MSKKKMVIGSVALVIVVVGWYAFRPERLFINQRVNESFPAVEAATASSTPETAVIASGQFHGVAHETSGLATVHRLSNGRQVLRFTNFATSNGPDVNVYLVAAPDARDDATVTTAGFVSLGPIKGNIGDQNYELPEGIDLNKYRAVTIWCRRFSVNFGTAPLVISPATAGSGGPVALAKGQFHGVAHETKGTAGVYRLPGGDRVLRLTQFETSNGPDVQVYLVAASDAPDNATVTGAGFVSLGALKGNVGDQNYEVPAQVDLAQYRAVTIWCRRFGVNFGTAPLTPLTN